MWALGHRAATVRSPIRCCLAGGSISPGASPRLPSTIQAIHLTVRPNGKTIFPRRLGRSVVLSLPPANGRAVAMLKALQGRREAGSADARPRLEACR